MQDIGHWMVGLRDFVAAWWPLLAVGFYVLLLWIFWRILQMMPRVKPNRVQPRSGSSVTWDDVAGVEEARNELMVELDGFEDTEQVVIMGASNRLQDLDPALLRPGRFDRQMLVAPPDLAGREAILRVHTRGKPLAADVDLAQIARQTSGLTGADLANIANEAAIFAGRRQAQYIAHADFDGAIERVVAGLQQKKALTEKERRILAYHEAGHALMSHLMGDLSPIQKVTIVSRGQALGFTLHLPSEDRYMQTKEELVDMMKIALAGRAAEEVVFGRVTNGAASDLEKATQMARSMVFEWGMSDN